MLRGVRYMRRFVERYPGLDVAIKEWVTFNQSDIEGQLRVLTLKRAKVEERLSAATDAVIDGLIDREIFHKKKDELLQARLVIDDSIAEIQQGIVPIPAPAKHYLELVNAFKRQDSFAALADAKALAKSVCSNLHARGKIVALQSSDAFQQVLEHGESIECALPQADSRTTEYFFKLLMGHTNLPTSPCSSGK